MDKDSNERSWFCVFNNPQKHYGELSPEQIAEKALEDWISDKPTRTGAVAYCISADGLIHLHMVLEDSNKARFSAIKKIFPPAHLKPTKGNREQAENYIQKKGKWEEKGEQVLYIARHGEIKGRQGQRKDMEVIGDLIESGKTPEEIMLMNFSYRRYSSMIREACLQRKIADTPNYRNVNVIWHVGDSGSGKSYDRILLEEIYGSNNVYVVTDYKNGFDRYQGEPILFLDELRPGSFRYSILLGILDKYKIQVSARYSNVYSLWEEVHITSPYAPEQLYKEMVLDADRDIETYEQLRRRISFVVYHWKESGEYKRFQVPMEQYSSYSFLRLQANKMEDGFVKVPDTQPAFGDL